MTACATNRKEFCIVAESVMANGRRDLIHTVEIQFQAPRAQNQNAQQHTQHVVSRMFSALNAHHTDSTIMHETNLLSCEHHARDHENVFVAKFAGFSQQIDAWRAAALAIVESLGRDGNVADVREKSFCTIVQH